MFPNRPERQQEVLSWIIGMGGWGKPISVSPKLIASDLRITSDNVRQAIRKLQLRGAIIAEGRDTGRAQRLYQATCRVHQI